MHSCGHCKGIAEATPEERRNRILRVRCGETTTSGRCKGGKKSPNKHRIDALNNFVVVGQTMSTLMRLPQITPRDVTIHRRQLVNGKRERISFMAINNLKRSVDDFHLDATRYRPREDTNKSSLEATLHDTKQDTKVPKTAPDGQRRRWSDGGATVPGSTSIQPQRRYNYHESFTKGPRMSMIKSESCVVQSADEILREYKEFAKWREETGEGEVAHSTRTGGFLTSELGKGVLRVKVPSRVEIGTEEKPQKLNRQNTSKMKRKRILMPSGDSTGSGGSSLERISGPGKRGSSSSIVARKSSRYLGRKPSTLRRSDPTMRNKKAQLNRPESPPGPSEEEIQELKELPVIRKFLKMPPSRPKVVCFDYPGVDLTHMDVKRAIEKVIPDAFESGKVVSVQFENVNVKLTTGGCENRWLIELKDFATRNLLIKNGLTPDCPGKHSLTDLTIPVPKRLNSASTNGEEDDEETIAFPPIRYPKKVQVKLNDSVAMEEYKLFLRRTAAEEKLQNVILLGVGRGDKLLSNML